MDNRIKPTGVWFQASAPYCFSTQAAPLSVLDVSNWSSYQRAAVSKGWEDGSADQRTGFSSWHPHGSSQLCLTPVPGGYNALFQPPWELNPCNNAHIYMQVKFVHKTKSSSLKRATKETHSFKWFSTNALLKQYLLTAQYLKTRQWGRLLNTVVLWSYGPSANLSVPIAEAQSWKQLETRKHTFGGIWHNSQFISQAITVTPEVTLTPFCKISSLFFKWFLSIFSFLIF